MIELHENYALDKTAQDLLFRHARTANTFADERTPGVEVAGEPPGAHTDGGKGCDQVGSKASLPERLGPLHRPLGMRRVSVQEQHPQGIEVSEEALLVRTGLVPVAQHVARHPDRRLCLFRGFQGSCWCLLLLLLRRVRGLLHLG